MYFTTNPYAKPGLPFYKTLLCLLCVLVLIVNGVSLLRNLDSLKTANALQARTERVSDELRYLNLLMVDAESGMRGYFLSGSEIYLGSMRTASREVERQLGGLATLLAENPSQLKNLSQLRILVYRKIGMMNQAVEVYRQGGLPDILAIAAYSDDKARMDEIRLQVVIMAREQNELIDARSAAFYQQYRHTMLLGLGINALAILVIVLFYRLIRRSFFARQLAQHALQQTNDNLETIVATRTEQLSVLSRHLISVAEEEKARLARELHDEMGANLTAIGIDLNTVGERLRASEPELAAMLARARRTLVDTVELKRRIVEDLRPSLLDNLGLSAALQSYCAEYSRLTGLDCDALVEGDVDAAGPMQSIALYRITQEALNNIAKYARARHVVVHLAREDDTLVLEVSDDGIGIAPDALTRPKSHGLLGMRERALLLGGNLRVAPGVNGVGTCVHATIPVPVPGSETDSAGNAGSGGAGRAPAVPAPGPALLLSAPHRPAGDHIRSSRPCSIHPHILPGRHGPEQ